MRVIPVPSVKLVVALAAAIAACGCMQNRDVELVRPSAVPSVASVGGGRAVTIARPPDARSTPNAIGSVVSAAGEVQALAPYK